ncbi:MAG: DUF2085 domain-containing protein [Anaerolineae bacterium]|jgi:uncharacterized membrane protein
MNDSSTEGISRHRSDRFSSLLPWLSLPLLALTLVAFLPAAPGGLLGKTALVGYAVCHQIPSHSFSLAGRQLPLCARCTGTFLGALVGLFGQGVVLRRPRAAEFPPPRILALLLCFTVAWALDGLNSYLDLLGQPHVYEPRNALRLITGTMNGLTISALVFPLLNVTLWRHPAQEPALRRSLHLGVLLLCEISLVVLVLSRRDILVYPLALLSAAGVLTLLTSVNSVIALILLRRENTAETWRQSIGPISVGLVLSLVQIGLIDGIRFVLTGTMEGFPPLH